MPSGERLGGPVTAPMMLTMMRLSNCGDKTVAMQSGACPIIQS